jgi:L-asparaginase
MQAEPIRILVTGGTFDKGFNEIAGALYFNQTHVPEMLRLGRCLLEVEISTLMLIDSLDMTDEGRRVIAEHGRNARESRIIITHGTDTMVETAAYLGREVRGKTIILTGAMVPYTFNSSDGLFNLGSALAFVQALPAGVYIAMNGRCFPWDRVRKNRDKGIFEPL